MTKSLIRNIESNRFLAIDLIAGLVVCAFVVIYVYPWTDDSVIPTFHRRYSDTILLGFISFTIANKLRTSKTRFEPLFWSFMGAAFISWFVLTIIRLTIWQKLSITNQGLAADVSYFLFYALMITAVEVKSFSNASKFLTQRSLISSLSVITFLLGSFSYLILVPTNIDSTTSFTLRQSFYFYYLLDVYLILRWWHLAWQAKDFAFLGYFLLGLASLNWFVDDLVEYLILSEQSSLQNKWMDWLWYLPYGLFYFGVRNLGEELEKNTSDIRYNPYHLLNSPLFFLGLISIWFLIESNVNPAVKDSALQNVQIVWLFITLALATFQIMELFETNKRRKLNFNKVQSSNDSLIHQLKQITRQMESQSSANQMILDTISNPIFTLDLQGKVLTSNLATTKLLGYSERELVDRNFSKLIPEEEEFHRFFDYQSYRQQLAKNSTGLEIESAVLTKTGQRITVHVTISQSSRMNRSTLIVSLADIRLQKKAEQQLHDLKDEFTANISHEFRTPLTIVSGVIENLLSQSMDDIVVDQLQTAKRNNLRLIHMVDQLLELSRIASDSMPINDIDASDWVKPICQSYNTIAKDKNIDYAVVICDSILIRGNQQAFENILYNLLSNAFKYTEHGGSINVLLEENDNHYQLIVADTGIGISRQEQSKIFDRFQRSNSDQQHSIPGVGIGLSLVKDLVNSMNWEINLESVPHKGSKFIVKINKSLSNHFEDLVPASIHVDEAQVSLLEAEIRQNSTKAFSKSKYLVLVIEDNIDMQRHLENILSPHHQCIVASNGKQGLSMAEEFLPDIIISDIMMPGIDGFEVLAILKDQSVTTHIPVLLLTAKSDQGSKIKGLSAEADDYLTKPFNAEELLIKIINQLKVRKKLQQKYEAQWQGFTQVEPEVLEQSIENSFLRDLNQTFEHNYTNPDFSMNVLAGELAMSERQLQRKVKALVDISPLELLKRFRLEKAKLELKQNVQIGLVAQSCGFSSQTYFGRCFKEHFGITPKNYQQQG